MVRGWLVRDGKSVASSPDADVAVPVILGAEKLSAVVSTVPVLVMTAAALEVLLASVVAVVAAACVVVAAFPPVVVS